MQRFVFSCSTACPTEVLQPFRGTTLAPCRGRSMVNTLVLQMETRSAKHLTPTDCCHPVPVGSAGAQPLRRADVVVSALHRGRSDPGASSRPPREHRKVDVATPCCGPLVSGCGPCEAELWLYRRGAHCTTPALQPWAEGSASQGPSR